MLIPVSLAEVSPAGDLRRRSALNFQRLHDAPFRFEGASRAFTVKEAPGDWIGRAILGLSLLGQTLRTTPAYLEETIARLPETLNARGYIGEILPPGHADENQVGGHNGFLRGLCEYYLWKRDPRVLPIIHSVIAHLMLPTRDLFAHYPDHLVDKLKDGKAVGLTVKNDGPWVGLSTDVGTVFFTLDALTQVYRIAPTPALRGLIETMMARYAQIDVERINAQTHSTLSTLRGILRWWEEVDGRPELLALVRARFARYRATAETEHYANYNWFNRPEWTEACGVVDAFLLAMHLWRATREAHYLRHAHFIYHNALVYAQRPNGGFGCDRCTGANGELFVRPHEKIFEAPWCCSMRGAEGLARAAQFSAFIDSAAPDDVWFAFYAEGDVTLRAAGGELTLRCTTEYPGAGRVNWTVLKTTSTRKVTLRFFVPPGVRGQNLTLRRGPATEALDGAGDFVRAQLILTAGDSLTLDFPLAVRVDQPLRPDLLPAHHRFLHGPLLLGRSGREAIALGAEETFRPLGQARYACQRTGTVLEPLGGMTYLSDMAARDHRLQVVFPEPRPT